MLWIPSALFAALHLFVIARPASAKYQPVFDTGIFDSLWHYLGLAIGPENALARMALLIALVAGLTWRSIRKKDPVRNRRS